MFERGLQMGDAPLLETLLLSGDMPSQDVHTVLLDMLILGVNLVSKTFYSFKNNVVFYSFTVCNE